MSDTVLTDLPRAEVCSAKPLIVLGVRQIQEHGLAEASFFNLFVEDELTIGVVSLSGSGLLAAMCGGRVPETSDSVIQPIDVEGELGMIEPNRILESLGWSLPGERVEGEKKPSWFFPEVSSEDDRKEVAGVLLQTLRRLRVPRDYRVALMLRLDARDSENGIPRGEAEAAGGRAV